MESPGQRNDEEVEMGSSIASSSISGRKWEKELLKISHREFFRMFSEPEGLDAPIVLFRKLLTNNMLEWLMEHTNLYGTQEYGSSTNTTALELE